MFILNIIDDKSLKNTLRSVYVNQQISYDFIESDDNLVEEIGLLNPDFLVLLADYGDTNYRNILDIIEDNNLIALINRIIIINNSTMEIEVTSDKIDVIDEFRINKDLVKLFSTQARKKILYVSDDKFMHVIVKDILTKNDFIFIEAFDGEEGLSVYKEESPDLILTDLDMPKIGGIELCKIIKIDLNDEFTEVVIFSSSTFEEDIQSAYLNKAKSYIIKPIKPEKLINKINKILV